jgi:hypothetical protein
MNYISLLAPLQKRGFIAKAQSRTLGRHPI